MNKDICFNFIFVIILNVLNFLYNKYFIQYLGLESLGIMKLFNQILQYLNLFELGIGSAAAYALYKPLANKDYKESSIIVASIRNFYMKIMLMIFAIGLVITPILPLIITTNYFDKRIYIYWILYLINTVIGYFFVSYVILFNANQEYFYVKVVQFVFEFVFKIFQIFIVIKYRNFLYTIICLIFMNVLEFIYFYRHYKKSYPFIEKTKQRYSKLKKDMGNLFWHKIGGVVVLQTDLILIAKLVNIETVGIYVNYQMIGNLLKILYNSVFTILTPRVGKFIALNDKENIYNHWKKLNTFFYMLSLIVIFCFYKMVNDFIALWVGREYILENSIVIFISFNFFVFIFRGIIDIFKDASGFFDDIQSPILESIINLLSSIILGYKYGLVGIIIGTVLSNILIILIYRPYLVFKKCFNKDGKLFLKLYMMYSIIAVIFFGSVNYLQKILYDIEVITWWDWIVKGIQNFILAFVVIAIINLCIYLLKYLKK